MNTPKRLLLALLFFLFLSPVSGQNSPEASKVRIFLKFKPEFQPQNNENPYPELMDQYLEMESFSCPFTLPEMQDVFLLTYSQGPDQQALINTLNKRQEIEYAEQVPDYQIFYTPNDLHPNQWHLNTVSGPLAWDLSRGNSVTIAITDDAVLTTHQDLAPKIWTNPGEIPGNGLDDDANGYIDDVNGYDVADNDNDPNPPAATVSNSNFTHGTHVAGCAAAATDNNLGVASTGFNALIIPVKAKQSSTSGGSLQAPYLAVDYAISVNADIINMSWGGGSASQTYQQLFDIAWQNGIVCIAAAGNSNTSAPMYPASYNHVISVGATNSVDQKASFSNYGSTIDVMAPGRDIWAPLAGANNAYGFLSGTSMACPITSGIAALMLQRDPSLSPDDLETCLESSCDNISAQNPSLPGQLGAGRVNAFAALQCLKPVRALFTSDTMICPGGSIQFTDQSYPNVTGWQWTFPGGTPATSNLQNPLVTYPTAGIYPVTLIVTNANGSDTLQRTSWVEVAVPTASLNCRSWSMPGNSQFNIPIDLTGEGPWTVVITDGTTNDTLSGITNSPAWFPISPTDTTIYSLVSVSDANCSGTVSCTDTIYTFSNFQTTCVTLQPGPTVGKDARIWDRPGYTNTPGGSSGALTATAWTWGGDPGVVRGLLEYDLSFVPSGSVIQSATLTYYKYTQTVFPFGHSQLNGPNDMWIQRITSPWNEATVTWASAPTVTTQNQLYVPADTNPNMDYVLDVTQLVQDHVDNPGTSFGFMNRLVTESYYRAVTLSSSDHPDSTLWPKLEVCYAAPTGCTGTGFVKQFRAPQDDQGHSVLQTFDGNYVVSGQTRSFGQGQRDLFLSKFDVNGNVIWQKTYGGTGDDYGYSVEVDQTADSGFVMVGTSYFQNQYRAMLLRLDAQGNIVWQKYNGGHPNDWEHYRSVTATSDGGAIATGNLASAGFPGEDLWVVKHDALGNAQWSYYTGGSWADHGTGVIELSNGSGFLICGAVRSLQNGNLGNMVIKLDNSGNTVWRKHYLLTTNDLSGILNLTETADGGFVTAGRTTSGFGNVDIRIIKADSLGNIEWARVFGGSGEDRPNNILQSSDGGYWVSGYMTGLGFGNKDMVLLKLDNTGNLVWSKAYGGSGDDQFTNWGDGMDLTADGGAILTGYSNSWSNTTDMILFKVDACGEAPCHSMDISPQEMTHVMTTPAVNLTQGTFSSTGNLTHIAGNFSFADTTLCIDTLPTSPQPNCNLLADFTFSPACTGDTVQFTDLSTDSLANIVQWNWDFGDGTIQNGPQNPSHIYTSPGTYTVQLAIANDAIPTCYDTISLTINIPNSLTAIASPDTTVCLGDSARLDVIVLCGTGPFTYQWAPATGLSNSLVRNPQAAPNSGISYSVTVTDANGNTATDAVLVNIDPGCCSPHATILGDTTVCLGDSLNFTAAGSIGSSPVWNWNFGPAATPASFTGSNPPPLFFNTPGAYTIQLSLNDSCGTDTTLRTVYVLPPPVAEAGNDTTICVPDSLQLGDTPIGWFDYSWSPATGLTDPLIANPIAGISGPVTYYLTVTNAQTGCSATDSIQISIPPALSLPGLGNDTSICLGQLLVLDPQSQNANTFLWSDNSTNSTLSVNSSGMYWVQAEGTCDTLRDTIQLTVDSLGGISLPADSSLCPGDSWEIFPTGDLRNLIWQDGSSDSSLVVSGPGIYWVENFSPTCGSVRDSINISATPVVGMNGLPADTTVCMGTSLLLDPGISNENSSLWSTGHTGRTQTVLFDSGPFWVTAFGTCDTLRDTIQVIQEISPDIELPGDTVICPTDSLLLTPTLYNGSDIIWSDGSTNLSNFATGPGWVWVEILADVCPSARDSIRIDHIPSPSVELGADSTLCEGETIQLDLGPQVGNSVLWSDGSTGQLVTVSQSGMWTVAVSNACETVSDTVQFWFAPPPFPVLPSDTNICPGDTFFVTPGGNYLLYQWQDGSTASSIGITEPGLYFVTVTDENGCEGRDSILIGAEGCETELYVPNAFSPNGDGLNDGWAPVENGVTVTGYVIYNRWGEVIFEAPDASVLWDGHYQGKPVQEGAYIYRIKFKTSKGIEGERSGTVTIIR